MTSSLTVYVWHFSYRFITQTINKVVSDFLSNSRQDGETFPKLKKKNTIGYFEDMRVKPQET